MKTLDAFAHVKYLRGQYTRFGIDSPTLHLVLGSGLGDALDQIEWKSEWEQAGEVPFTEVPGLSAATVVGHAGVYRYLKHRKSGKVLTLQQGRLHGYEGHTAREAIQTVMAPFLAGTRNFILTNAAGGLVPEFNVGSLMMIRDHVNMTGQNPLIGLNSNGPNGLPIGPRFPDMSKAYDPELRIRLKSSLSDSGLSVNEGVYLGLLGPSFETPAEVALFGAWGLHAVGMSTVWEAIALKHAGARIAGMSLISNEACGLGGSTTPLSHEDILRETSRAAQDILAGLLTFSAREFVQNV